DSEWNGHGSIGTTPGHGKRAIVKAKYGKCEDFPAGWTPPRRCPGEADTVAMLGFAKSAQPNLGISDQRPGIRPPMPFIEPDIWRIRPFMPPRANLPIIFSICVYCFSRRLTSAGWVPEPRATRARR